MLFWYSIGVRLYVTGIRVAALWNPKAKLWVRGRKNLSQQLEQAAQQLGGKTVWFHCASLGEFEMARPLMEKIRAEKPGYKILLTFFSPSGYEIRKDWKGADAILYLPADTSGHARKFVDALHPEIAVFVKYEYWLHYLRALAGRKIKTYVVCAVFRKDQSFFKWYGKPFRQALQQITAVFVQDYDSGLLARELGITPRKAGDMRFDRVQQIAAAAKPDDFCTQFAGHAFTLVGGSTWPEEEKILCGWIQQHPEAKLILVPHDISATHLARIEKQLQVKHIRYSQRTQSTGNEQVLIIDNIGMLASLYRLGKAAVVGGGFSGALHNILEAAAHSVPVLFGPHHERFHEARALSDAGGGFTFSDAGSFEKQLQPLMHDETFRTACGQKAGAFIHDHSGSTNQIFSAIFTA